MDRDRDLIQRACDKGNVIAVIGASNNPGKYGYRIYNDLRQAGYTVYPVNPNEAEVQGDKAYPNLASLPEKPDVINVVTPPAVTEKVVDEAVEAGIGIIWMQPGAESDKAIDRARQKGVGVIFDTCIMVERKML